MTTEEKLINFSRIILDEATAAANAITAEADADHKMALFEAENEIAADTGKRVSREISEFSAETARAESLRTLEVKRNLIMFRDELADKLFSEVEEKANSFTATDGYREYMKNAISAYAEYLRNPQVTLLIRACDRAAVTEILEELSVKTNVYDEPGIKLGGFRISMSGKLIDETLDERMKQQRAWFTENSGFIID